MSKLIVKDGRYTFEFGSLLVVVEDVDQRDGQIFATVTITTPTGAILEGTTGYLSDSRQRRAWATGAANRNSHQPGPVEDALLGAWVAVRDYLAPPATLPQQESMANILQTVDTDFDYVVEGRIESGTLTMISGQAKAGKSLAVLQLARCVATGTPYLGCAISPQLDGRER